MRTSAGKTILVVDDEKDIVDLIAYSLETDGFAVIKAYDGQTALRLVQTEKPSLVLLDLLLPGIKGLDVCRAIRKNQETQHLPIIMITAMSDTVDRILGLEIGADDYITKPFNVRELIARVRAILRREEQRLEMDAGEILSFGGICINFGSYRITVDDRPIDLSFRELKLLAFFIRHPGRVYSRDQLLDYVWGDESYVEPRTVDVHISRLRAVIENDKDDPRYIQTVRGIGYKFRDSQSCET
jgi:two-component system alkaline phosphatase synthesis response regulator PhoP